MAKLRTLIEGGQWYKGNLHLHTTMSDGHLDPAGAVAVYRDHGYHFLAVTDHGKWGIHDDLQSDDFIIFGGTELGKSLSGDDGFCHHTVHMAIPGDTPFVHGQDVHELSKDMDMQQTIDYMNANGCVSIYCHPRWSHVSMEAYSSIANCIGMEIYNNASELACACGESVSYFERSMWAGDKMLAFACDDAHRRSGYLGGWITVKAKSLTHKDVMDAIKAGSFYASTGGPEIHDFYVEDGVAHIKCEPSKTISVFGDASVGGRYPVESDILMTEFAWPFTKEWLPREAGMNCVWAVCADEKGRKSWTQPIWLT
ncbi:MAG: hypothetical protein FWE06_01300 [Oscillospiraceae bacterium]|nr:hypothetical protein [Oscillospiraceae bacterium]